MTNPDLISLLRDALRLWGVTARVEAAESGVTLTADSGDVLSVEQGPPPLRWWLTTAKRRRPVAGITALLEAVRVALGMLPGTLARMGTGAALSAPPPLEGGDWGEGWGRHRAAAPPPAVPLPPGEGESIPITLITGFLGSGKTTLVSRLLRSPALARTAVIVNEFGEIGLDHDLIERGDETLLQLTTGCLCCAVQSSISNTLLDLQRRRNAGEIAFDRVLVETSGLADPAPILHALMTDDALRAPYAIGAVVTLIDAQLGETTLRRHPEARRQASLADILLLSKTDIAAPQDTLLAALRDLSPAPVHTDLTDPAALFARHTPHTLPDAAARHTKGITSAVIERDQPIPTAALTLFIQALAAQCGPRLLRMKGIFDLRESDGRKVIVHGVQHVFSPPVLLAAGPAVRPGTRAVVIGQDIPPWFPARLLDAIVAEVEDELARRTRPAFPPALAEGAGGEAAAARPNDEADSPHISDVSNPSLAAPISAAPDIGRP